MKRKKKRIAIIAGFLVILMLLSLIISAIGSLSASAVSQSELNALQNKAAEIAKQQKELKSRINSAEYEQKTVIEKKEILDAQAEATRQEIDNLAEQITAYEGLIAEKETELEAARQAEAEQFELFKARMRTMEENGSISYICVLFEASSYSDFLCRVDFVSEIMSYDNALVHQFEAAKVAVSEAKAGLEATQSGQIAAKEALIQKEAEIEAQTAQAAALIAELEDNLDDYTADYEQIERMEKELERQIDDIIEELERQGSGDIESSGTYIWPSEASKRVTSPFGKRLHPILGIYRNHNGIDIGAAKGTNVLAADSGKIVTSKYSSSYGHYIMISHGDSRYTLYAHLSKRKVSVGDKVTQGQVIGLIGSTGYSTGPHLHFEIIENGSRVNPLNYYTNYIKAWS